MSSNNRRLIWNTRERLLSTDLNDADALLHAKGTDEIAAALTGDLFKTSLPLSGVLSGGIVSGNGLDNTITISPTLGLKNGTPASGLDSPYLKIETVAPVTVDLTPFVDGGNPRWVAIEVAPGDTAEVVSARDIFQPALGTFIPQNVDKIRRPEPVFTVNAGVPAPAPMLPLGNPDVIPLAYVYVRAASPAILTTDVIRCRAVINPNTLAGQAVVANKGGVNVLAAGGTTVQMRDYTCRFFLNPANTRVLGGVNAPADLLASTNWVNPEIYPLGGDAPIYVYVASPPFPVGYDSDVADNREWLDVSGRIPSSPPNAINGILVWSLQAPTDNTRMAPHPGPTISLNDSTWNGGTITAASQTSYLGSVSVNSLAPAGVTMQTTHGDRVRITEAAKLNYDSQVHAAPAATVGAAGVFANKSPFLLNTYGQGLGVVLRDAVEWDIVGQDLNIGSGENYSMLIEGSGEPTSVGAVPGMPRFGRFNVSGDAYREQSQNQVRTFLGTGAFTWSHSLIGAGSTRFAVVVLGYQDPVLANR